MHRTLPLKIDQNDTAAVATCDTTLLFLFLCILLLGRCILLPDVSAMRALVDYEFDSPSMRDSLRRFSLAAVFDGHSGWRASEYLSQHVAPLLITHSKILDKLADAAILDTFQYVDEKVSYHLLVYKWHQQRQLLARQRPLPSLMLTACKLNEVLEEEEDSSGSTATLALYDGRRHVLTVANVGDSMCVLSRGGRAVTMLHMHRLNNAEERQRVERAGGTVINSRSHALNI